MLQKIQEFVTSVITLTACVGSTSTLVCICCPVGNLVMSSMFDADAPLIVTAVFYTAIYVMMFSLPSTILLVLVWVFVEPPCNIDDDPDDNNNGGGGNDNFSPPSNSPTVRKQVVFY